MRIAYRIALVWFAISSSPAATSASQEAAPKWQNGPSAVNIDSIVRPVFVNKLQEYHIAGAMISVVHRGDVVYSAGFGEREVFRELPVDPVRTVFRIGSITKVMTGVAILQLVDAGQLDLDTDVNEYLRDFRIEDTFSEPVRVRNLLTHTAGFDQIGLGRHAGSAEEVLPLGDFLAGNLVRIRPPEEVSTYDTYAITLAGYIVEAVSGMSFDAYLQRHIFEPLDMTRTGIAVPDSLLLDLASGYEFAGTWESPPWEYMNTAPASSVNSTAADMARFILMLLEGGQYRGRTILSEASARAMLTQQFTNHPEQPGYGYTFFEDRSHGVEAWSHGGSMTGYGSLLFLVPADDFGVFMAWNQESARLPRDVLNRLIPELLPVLSDAELPRVENVDARRFTGIYANSMYHHGDPATGWRRRSFEVEATEDGDLLVQGSRAYPAGPLTFQSSEGPLLTFRDDENGSIEYLFIDQTVYERLPGDD